MKELVELIFRMFNPNFISTKSNHPERLFLRTISPLRFFLHWRMLDALSVRMPPLRMSSAGGGCCGTGRMTAHIYG